MRFTDRARYSVQQMLDHAKTIEEWLNRPLADQSTAKAHIKPHPDDWDAIEGKMRDAETKEKE